MKMHKITMYVIDLAEYGEEDLRLTLSQDVSGIVHIADLQTVDIGEFEDEHELNFQAATTEQHEKYFK